MRREWYSFVRVFFGTFRALKEVSIRVTNYHLETYPLYRVLINDTRCRRRFFSSLFPFLPIRPLHRHMIGFLSSIHLAIVLSFFSPRLNKNRTSKKESLTRRTNLEFEMGQEEPGEGWEFSLIAESCRNRLRKDWWKELFLRNSMYRMDR